MSDIVVAQQGALAEITRAEMDQQVATAKRYPRDVKRSIQRAIDLATMDTDTAKTTFYTLSRAGKAIEGPSVRLAEIVQSTWGNLRCAARVVAVDDKNVTAQGVCFDLENNTANSVEVKRRIVDKYGKRYNDDMIITTSNAACAIAFRNALFLTIPRAYVNSVYKVAKKVACGDEKTIGQRVDAAMKAFDKLGVPEKAICRYLHVERKDQIGVAHIETLLGVFNAIEEGETSVAHEFGSWAEEATKAVNGGTAEVVKDPPATGNTQVANAVKQTARQRFNALYDQVSGMGIPEVEAQLSAYIESMEKLHGPAKAWDNTILSAVSTGLEKIKAGKGAEL